MDVMLYLGKWRIEYIMDITEERLKELVPDIYRIDVVGYSEGAKIFSTKEVDRQTNNLRKVIKALVEIDVYARTLKKDSVLHSAIKATFQDIGIPYNEIEE